MLDMENFLGKRDSWPVKSQSRNPCQRYR